MWIFSCRGLGRLRTPDNVVKCLKPPQNSHRSNTSHTNITSLFRTETVLKQPCPARDSYGHAAQRTLSTPERDYLLSRARKLVP